MRILDKAEDTTLLGQLAGPLFILCSFALCPDHLALFFLGAAGLFLCARFQMRGFVYSLLLLGIAAGFEHAVHSEHHLFLLGLEISYAIAFLVTALHAEEQGSFLTSLFSQIDAKDESMTHVEEEIAKLQESSASERIAHEEQIRSLQKEIEEIQSEYASLSVLNEVLRQTYARESVEKETIKQALERVQAQCEDLQREHAQNQGTSFAAENRNLIEQLNSVRAERAQARLMNETLASLYAKEQEKVKEANALLASLQKQQPVAEDRQELLHLQDKVKTCTQAEALYKQLRVQFEEKNQILHETRAKLFHAETELQALRIEKTEGSMLGIPKEFLTEISALEEKLADVENENEELQSLITSLLSTR